MAKLFVVSAASGSGKTSLLAEAIKQLDGIDTNISHTTRPQRDKEKNGVNYHFVDDKKFDEMLQKNEFVESADVFGYRYGTSSHSLKDAINKNKDNILEIDYQGALLVKEQIPEAISIFILPPSLEALKKRLLARNDNTSNLDLRQEKCIMEMQQHTHYDYIVINDDFATAVADICAIVRSSRLCKNEHKLNHKPIFKEISS